MKYCTQFAKAEEKFCTPLETPRRPCALKKRALPGALFEIKSAHPAASAAPAHSVESDDRRKPANIRAEYSAPALRGKFPPAAKRLKFFQFSERPERRADSETSEARKSPNFGCRIFPKMCKGRLRENFFGRSNFNLNLREYQWRNTSNTEKRSLPI